MSLKQKEQFTRLTISEMKALKEQEEKQKAMEVAMQNLDELVTIEAEKLAQELVDEGYDVDSFEIEADHKLKGSKLIVTLKVIQEGRTIVFDLADES